MKPFSQRLFQDALFTFGLSILPIFVPSLLLAESTLDDKVSEIVMESTTRTYDMKYPDSNLFYTYLNIYKRTDSTIGALTGKNTLIKRTDNGDGRVQWDDFGIYRVDWVVDQQLGPKDAVLETFYVVVLKIAVTKYALAAESSHDQNYLFDDHDPHNIYPYETLDQRFWIDSERTEQRGLAPNVYWEDTDEPPDRFPEYQKPFSQPYNSKPGVGDIDIFIYPIAKFQDESGNYIPGTFSLYARFPDYDPNDPVKITPPNSPGFRAQEGGATAVVWTPLLGPFFPKGKRLRGTSKNPNQVHYYGQIGSIGEYDIRWSAQCQFKRITDQNNQDLGPADSERELNITGSTVLLTYSKAIDTYETYRDQIALENLHGNLRSIMELSCYEANGADDGKESTVFKRLGDSGSFGENHAHFNIWNQQLKLYQQTGWASDDTRPGVPSLLRDGYGDSGCWARYFIEHLWCQGIIGADIKYLIPKNGNAINAAGPTILLLLQNWSVSPTAKGNTGAWPYSITLGKALTPFGKVPPPGQNDWQWKYYPYEQNITSGVSDFIEDQGIPGQNDANPVTVLRKFAVVVWQTTSVHYLCDPSFGAFVTEIAPAGEFSTEELDLWAAKIPAFGELTTALVARTPADAWDDNFFSLYTKHWAGRTAPVATPPVSLFAYRP